MKARLISIGLIALLALVIGLFAAWFTNGRAQAALGNTSIPVWCYNLGWVHAGDNIFLNCLTPPGSVSFVNLQKVPAGYYFMITDWQLTPVTGTTGSATIDVNLEDAYGTGSGLYAINFLRSVDGATTGQHYISPMWVLVADHRLELVALGSTQQAFEIRVTGYLTTNLNYLPLLSN